MNKIQSLNKKRKKFQRQNHILHLAHLLKGCSWQEHCVSQQSESFPCLGCKCVLPNKKNFYLATTSIFPIPATDFHQSLQSSKIVLKSYFFSLQNFTFVECHCFLWLLYMMCVWYIIIYPLCLSAAIKLSVLFVVYFIFPFRFYPTTAFLSQKLSQLPFITWWIFTNIYTNIFLFYFLWEKGVNVEGSECFALSCGTSSFGSRFATPSCPTLCKCTKLQPEQH